METKRATCLRSISRQQPIHIIRYYSAFDHLLGLR